jgi:hypothetical protein
MAWIVLVDCRACGHVDEHILERECAGFESNLFQGIEINILLTRKARANTSVRGLHPRALRPRFTREQDLLDLSSLDRTVCARTHSCRLKLIFSVAPNTARRHGQRRPTAWRCGGEELPEGSSRESKLSL